jgi:asparagine synthase (glutamine-hydrolysing)
VPVAAWDALLRTAGRSAASRINGDRIHKLAAVLPASSRQELYDLIRSNWRPPGDAVAAWRASTGPLHFAAAASNPSFLREMMAIDLSSALPDGILAKVDRTTMAVGLECRAPFLADDVVDAASRLSDPELARGNVGKLALRELLSRYVPRELATRPKSGFLAPLDTWLRSDLRDWAESLLDVPSLTASGFDAGIVRQKWSEHVGGARNWQFALWPVLMWQSFLGTVARDNSNEGVRASTTLIAAAPHEAAAAPAMIRVARNARRAAHEGATSADTAWMQSHAVRRSGRHSEPAI